MVIISIGNIDLGNNFTYDHFINALSEKAIDRIYSKEWDLESDIRIVGKGNYSKVCLNTCGSDLSDYLRS
jgi:hypothetical protein